MSIKNSVFESLCKTYANRCKIHLRRFGLEFVNKSFNLTTKFFIHDEIYNPVYNSVERSSTIIYMTAMIHKISKKQKKILVTELVK